MSKFEFDFTEDQVIELLHGNNEANQWYEATIYEGRNRGVRKLWQSQGLEVSRLMRIGFGKYKLPKYLKVGNFIDIEH